MSNTPNQKGKKTIFCAALGILLAFNTIWSPAIALPPYQIIQVTNNNLEDESPQISGNNVVWYGSDGNDTEIFFWDGDSITQVTYNSYDDYYPQISGNNVVWYGSEGIDDEIFFWDGSSITQVTDNSYVDQNPHISGKNVVWAGSDGINDEVFFWGGGSITQVSDDNYDSYYDDPQISGNNVVWTDGCHCVYFWDGTETTKIIDTGGFCCRSPQISGNNVVWYCYESGDQEILFWDGTEITQITDNSYYDHEPQISGNNVVWQGWDGSDYEIFLWDGSLITQVTDNSYPDIYPQISGNNVVWQGSDGSDYEIFFWDGSSITQVTDNSYDDLYPRISGNNIVWYGNDSSDGEIFFARFVNMIEGTKWHDKNGNYVQDLDEQGLGGWRIFADLNKNGQFDANEPNAITDNNGNYQLAIFTFSPNVVIAEEQKSCWEQTVPGGAGTHTVRIVPGEAIEGINFGNARPTEIHPSVWQQHEQDKLLASDGAGGDFFGHSVSISGNTAIIGAYYDDDNGLDSGSVYVFALDEATCSQWEQVDKLTASDGAYTDRFGYSVSIGVDTAIVGAFQDDDNGSNSGSAYIFRRDGESWNEQAKLTPSDGNDSDYFGYSVSVSGDYAIVGAYQDDDKGSNSGSAYIFYYNGTSWMQQAKLTAEDGAAGDNFGYSVSISGDYSIAGAPSDDDKGNGSGSVYIFKRDGSSWNEQAKLTASDGASYDWFGASVSISGNDAIASARNDYDNGSESGSAYIFYYNGASWSEQAKLTASDGAAYDWFGCSVSVSGDSAVVGAFQDDDNGSRSGSAYIFERDGTSWSEQVKLVASDGAASDFFGFSVSISSDYAIAGAYGDDDKGSLSGSAYMFGKALCPISDQTGDCFVNFEDLAELANEWLHGV